MDTCPPTPSLKKKILKSAHLSYVAHYSGTITCAKSPAVREYARHQNIKANFKLDVKVYVFAAFNV